jgi:hypothetical protein
VTPPLPAFLRAGTLRTGLTEALMTDEQDDSYDLSWLNDLSSDHIAAIAQLRRLLEHDPDPVDRHYMFCELEQRLYRCRDASTSALEEYDTACRSHDDEMDGIRDALFLKFGKVPLLQTYTQMAIRQQKAKNWTEATRWAERGIALYGETPARPEAVADLNKRLAGYRAKLASRTAMGTATPAPEIGPIATISATETLICVGCGEPFKRVLARGRKPGRCPQCRGGTT